jgi:flagellar biosynthetic protein FliP
MDGWLASLPAPVSRLVTPSRIAAIALVAVSAGSLGWLVRERHDSGRVHLLSDARLPTSDLALMEAAFNRAKLADYVVEEGRILVPKTRQSDYVRALVDAGALPKEFGGSLRRALEHNSPWQSRATQAELLRVAMQEELSLVLCSMPGIRRASVLVDAEEPPAGRGAVEKTASVSVETEPDTALEPQRVRAIRVLVAASIAGLPAERVAVTDLRTGLVFTGPVADSSPRESDSAADAPPPPKTHRIASDDRTGDEPGRHPSIAALPSQPSSPAGANAPADLGDAPSASPAAAAPAAGEGDPDDEPGSTDAAAASPTPLVGGTTWLCLTGIRIGRRRQKPRRQRRFIAAWSPWIMAALALNDLAVNDLARADPPLAAVNATADLVPAGADADAGQPAVIPGGPSQQAALQRAPAVQPGLPPVDDTPRRPAAAEVSLQSLVERFFSGPSGGASLTAALVFGVASLAPAVLLMATSFVRMSVVLSLLRQGLGAGGVPSNQIVTSLALFLTALVMWPIWQACWREGVEPLAEGRIEVSEALERGSRPVRDWMRSQIDAAGNGATLTYFVTLGPRGETPASSVADTVDPTTGLDVLLPAFLVSELKTAFSIGLRLLVPFLAIDVVAGIVVAAAGLPSLSPTTIGLPLKLAVFVAADGWTLVVRSLVEGYLRL